MDPISQQLVMGAAGSGGSEKLYVEDVFSTWLYTGNGSTQTITNGIDLSGKGGLVWIKSRSGATGHRLVDTIRGATKSVDSSGFPAPAEATESTGLTSFSSTGFSIGADTDYNTNSSTYASWSFRKQAKFFDVVTYTGNGSNRAISHSLGSVPGCIIVKRTDTASDWYVYHRSLANTDFLYLNAFSGSQAGATVWNNTTPTTASFSIGTSTGVNASGGTYIAYLFAHNAGGFGSTGADDVISCGSYTGNGSSTGPVVTLGWEPQWILLKRSDTSDDWVLCDTVRSLTLASNAALYPYSSIAETFTSASRIDPTPTGFQLKSTTWNASGGNYIYIAIRRGPMKTPTDATKVFNAVARTGTGADATVTCGFQADACFIENRTSTTLDSLLFPRLTGTRALSLTINNAEAPYTTTFVQTNPWDVMDGIKLGTTSTQTNASGVTFVNYFFKRAPCFFDIATYAGTGAALNVNHNLGATPELMFVKSRTAVASFQVYFGDPTAYLGAGNLAKTTASDRWNNTSPTPSVFTVGTVLSSASASYIAYLFASCPGVSKVGTYTGTATTLNVNCGFTGGARFVLIKRIDSSGDWFYWDTARGIIAGNDPYLINDATTAEVTNTDYIDPLSSGFQISSTAPAAINASGGTYLYLAIA